MSKLMAFVVGFTLLATNAMATVYQCAFDTSRTQNWVPAAVVLNTDTGVVWYNGVEENVRAGETSVTWGAHAMSSANRRIEIIYRLRITENLQASINVTMTRYRNNYTKRTTCQVIG